MASLIDNGEKTIRENLSAIDTLLMAKLQTLSKSLEQAQTQSAQLISEGVAAARKQAESESTIAELRQQLISRESEIALQSQQLSELQNKAATTMRREYTEKAEAETARYAEQLSGMQSQHMTKLVAEKSRVDDLESQLASVADMTRTKEKEMLRVQTELGAEVTRLRDRVAGLEKDAKLAEAEIEHVRKEKEEIVQSMYRYELSS